MSLSLNVNARTSAIGGMCAGMNTLSLYASPRPAFVDEAPGSPPLATFYLNTPLVAVDGQVWLVNPVAVDGLLTGTATWGRLATQPDVNGMQGWIDGSVDVTASDFRVDSTSIVAGSPVVLTSLRLTMPSE